MGIDSNAPVEKRKELITNLFDTYYNTPGKEVYFDTNRGWSMMLPLIKDLFPYTKVILTVRDINWILDSFEQLARKNIYDLSSMFSPEENVNVYTRCSTLMREDRTLGFAYMALKQALYSKEKDMLFLLEYDKLATKPEQTMKMIHNFLDLNDHNFNYDFNNVEASYDEFDADVNLKGLHTIRRKVEKLDRLSILPPDILQTFKDFSVWR